MNLTIREDDIHMHVFLTRLAMDHAHLPGTGGMGDCLGLLQ
jgi:hypothetical protein